MNYSSRTPLAALILVALGPFNARAGGSGPLPGNSTVPAIIRLVGSSAGIPDSTSGQFKIVARNVANIPCGGCTVVIDLSSCTDLSICANQMDPDAVTNCASKLVRKVTNVNGEATFTVLGCSKGDASSLVGFAKVFAQGNLIGSPTAAAFDLDGSGGVGAGDLSVWLGDFASGLPWGRSDYDGSGSIGANDLAEWLGVFAAAGSTQSCGASCP